MPRIRTIKPEFWSSPGIETTSPWSRLLFIAMWNWADDAGRGTCQLRELQAFAFPYDEEDVSPEVATMAGFKRTLAEVRDQYHVAFYKVDGRPYYAIPSWRKHQRNERTAKSKYPGPEEGKEWDFLGGDQRRGGTSDILRRSVAEAENGPAEDTPDPGETPEGEEAHDLGASGVIPLFGNLDTPPDQGSSGTSDILRHGAAEAPQSSGPGTGEQGNRGTGEVTTSPRSARMREADLEAEFQEWYGGYPKKKEPGDALRAYIKARKKATAQELLDGRDRYIALDRQHARGFTKYPATWLNKECWLDEYDNEPLRPAANGYQPYKNPTDQSVYDERLI